MGLQIQISRAKRIVQMFIFVAHLFKAYLYRARVSEAQLLMRHRFRAVTTAGVLHRGP